MSVHENRALTILSVVLPGLHTQTGYKRSAEVRIDFKAQVPTNAAFLGRLEKHLAGRTLWGEHVSSRPGVRGVLALRSRLITMLRNQRSAAFESLAYIVFYDYAFGRLRRAWPAFEEVVPHIYHHEDLVDLWWVDVSKVSIDDFPLAPLLARLDHEASIDRLARAVTSGHIGSGDQLKDLLEIYEMEQEVEKEEDDIVQRWMNYGLALRKIDKEKEEARKQAAEEGRAAGHAEGHAEGHVEGMNEVVLLTLRAAFPAQEWVLPPGLSASAVEKIVALAMARDLEGVQHLLSSVSKT